MGRILCLENVKQPLHHFHADLEQLQLCGERVVRQKGNVTVQVERDGPGRHLTRQPEDVRQEIA